jgi:hypothetical protein
MTSARIRSIDNLLTVRGLCDQSEDATTSGIIGKELEKPHINAGDEMRRIMIEVEEVEEALRLLGPKPASTVSDEISQLKVLLYALDHLDIPTFSTANAQVSDNLSQSPVKVDDTSAVDRYFEATSRTVEQHVIVPLKQLAYVSIDQSHRTLRSLVENEQGLPDEISSILVPVVEAEQNLVKHCVFGSDPDHFASSLVTEPLKRCVAATILEERGQRDVSLSPTAHNTSKASTDEQYDDCCVSLVDLVFQPINLIVDHAEKHAVVDCWRCSLSSDEICLDLDDDDSPSSLVTTSLNETCDYVISPATLGCEVELSSGSQQVSSDSKLSDVCPWTLEISGPMDNFATIHSAEKHSANDISTFLGASFVESGNFVDFVKDIETNNNWQQLLVELQKYFWFCLISMDHSLFGISTLALSMVNSFAMLQYGILPWFVIFGPANLLALSINLLWPLNILVSD